MRKGSYPRLLGFLATLYIPSLAIGVILGEAVAKRALPLLVSLPFAALVIMALASGHVWNADRDSRGAYKVSRAKEPFWYWVAVGMWAATSLAFLFMFAWYEGRTRI